MDRLTVGQMGQPPGKWDQLSIPWTAQYTPGRRHEPEQAREKPGMNLERCPSFRLRQPLSPADPPRSRRTVGGAAGVEGAVASHRHTSWTA